MVLDPLTALGIASNAVQLAEFSSRLISRGHQIFKSTDGALTENLELEAIASGLLKMNNTLARSLRSDELHRTLSDDDKELQAICEGCRCVGTELINALQKLKIRGNHGKWKSFRQALKTIWSKDEIDKLSKRLEGFRKQLDTYILVSLRTNIDLINSYQSKQVEQSDEMYSRTQKVIDQFLRSSDKNQQHQADLLEAVLQKNSQADHANLVACTPTPSTGMAEEERQSYQISQFLSQLRYEGMPDRHERITKAHKKTFDWIYQGLEVSNGSWSNFVEWLENGVGPYWITGKAGAGKSTLCKYLYGDPRTRQHLQSWAGKNRLVIAGFFFWSSGTKLQMSQEGLLQTLLFEALSQCPFLIPLLFPQRWRSLRFSSMQHCTWTKSELLQAFELLCKQSKLVKFCFFIDGLDECGGDHGELVSLFTEIITSSDVRVCLSSRPWLLFEDAFGQSSNLILQDLTYPDIKHYIATTLCENARYLELEQEEPVFASDLVEKIAKKASGVWLWVYLVTHSLLDGLTNSDKLSDLQRRLKSTPTDLEDLYKKMLDSIDGFYVENASQLFQTVLAAQRPPSLLGLSFADEDDPLFALQAEIEPLGDEAMLSRCHAMRRRLNSRCKGLLEVSSPKSSTEWAPLTIKMSSKCDLELLDSHQKPRICENLYYEPPDSHFQSTADLKVEYLHRTVRDFMTRPEVLSKLVAATKTNFDPDLALCRSYLLQLKTLHPKLVTRERFWELINNYMYHTVVMKAFTTVSLMSMFDELDRTATKLAVTPRFVSSTVGRAFSVDSGIHWTSTGPGGRRGNTLSAFAVQYELYQFIEAKVQESDFDLYDQNGRPLLDYATVDWKPSCTKEARRIYDDDRVLRNRRIIKLLLERGADPNHRYASSTTWCNVLVEAQEVSDSQFAVTSRPRSMRRWADTVELFLQHGADPRVKLINSDVTSMIRDTFAEWNPSRTKDLERTLDRSKRRWAHLGRLTMRKQYEVYSSKVFAWKEFLFKHNPRFTALPNDSYSSVDGKGLTCSIGNGLSSATLCQTSRIRRHATNKKTVLKPKNAICGLKNALA